MKYSQEKNGRFSATSSLKFHIFVTTAKMTSCGKPTFLLFSRRVGVMSSSQWLRHTTFIKLCKKRVF